VLNLACRRNSSDRSTKSTPSSLNALRLLVNTGFQVLFHSPPGVLFTFPSQYYFTIGHHRVFRLGGWSPLLPTRFLVSRGTLDPVTLVQFSHTRLLRSLVPVFHPFILLTFESFNDSPQPRCTEVQRFGLFRVRSPLLAESRLISLPGATEMFQFTPSPLRTLCIHVRIIRHLP
jgi:hypothetical protein